MPQELSGVCRCCGLEGRGLHFEKWVPDTFTNWDSLRGGQIICEACQFCFTDRNEPLTRKTGKDKPQRMRNYSHFVTGKGEWIPCSKGDKRRMRELLADEPAVAIIAVSGQKHIIFRAQEGWWQFEEQTLRPFPADLARLLGIVEQLYAGFSKADIETGRYPQHRIILFGVARWRELESEIKRARGTVRLSLALFLAQKEEDDGLPDDSGQPSLALLARNI